MGSWIKTQCWELETFPCVRESGIHEPAQPGQPEPKAVPDGAHKGRPPDAGRDAGGTGLLPDNHHGRGHSDTWVGGNTLSQTTETSSTGISGSVEMDLDMERLKVYGQALKSNVYHLVSTLIPVDGLKGLDMVKNPDKVKDCEQADGSTHHILDLEEAANAEELCKAREERAEMKVCV